VLDSRRGFTLIEILVAMALIVLLLAILAEAFAVGLESFGKLKAIGDMNDRLRQAAHIIRQDLAADHFEGSLRLSDANFGPRRPVNGFFYIRQHGWWPYSFTEGQADGIISYRSPYPVGNRSTVLYMTVKRRGNRDEDYFTASIPNPKPLLEWQNKWDQGDPTTYFFQPEDHRRQIGTKMHYSSQWAEVAYFLQPLPLSSTAKGTRLYTLHRRVRVLVAENLTIPNVIPAGDQPFYQDMSFRVTGTTLTMNSPWDVTTDWRRSLYNFIITKDPIAPTSPRFAYVDSMLLTDVVSFTVQVVWRPGIDPWWGSPRLGYPFNNQFTDVGTFDSNTTWNGILAVQVVVRIWDVRTDQTRQITIIQDM
jgi:prepilin-type N-terminal cleavage/methylation domain-containing protein